jgi:hypothetical protein
MSQQINLFNPIFLKQKKYFSAVTMVEALALILFGCILLTIYARLQLSTLTAEAAVTTNQLKAAQTQLAKVTAEYGPKQKNKMLEAELQEAETNVISLQRVFEILKKGEFGNTKGYAEYWRAFARQSTDGVWLTGLSIYGAGNEIGVKGRALQPEMVPAYITRLKREPIMQGKSFSALEMQAPDAQSTDKSKQNTDVPYIEFSLHSSGMVKEQADSSGVKSK